MLNQLRQKNKERQDAWPGAEEVDGDLAFRGLELAGEIGELCNVLKKIERIRRGVAGSKPEELPGLMAHVKEELGDAIICVDLIAMDLGIELTEAVPEKFDKTSIKYDIPVLFDPPEPECPHANVYRVMDPEPGIKCADCGKFVSDYEATKIG